MMILELTVDQPPNVLIQGQSTNCEQNSSHSNQIGESPCRFISTYLILIVTAKGSNKTCTKSPKVLPNFGFARKGYRSHRCPADTNQMKGSYELKDVHKLENMGHSDPCLSLSAIDRKGNCSSLKETWLLFEK